MAERRGCRVCPLAFLRGHAEVGSRGILVPGGFGQRGTEGMILAIKWAREQKIPFLGICLGFQLAVLEWARSVLGVHGELRPRLSFSLVLWLPLTRGCRREFDRVST